MKLAHVTVPVVWDGERLVFADPVSFRAVFRRRLKPGEGESFIVRIEREADAKRHHQMKWAYGYVFKQVSEATGYTVPEVDAMFRALFLPGDVATLSLMSYEQMRDFNLQCEAYAATVIGVVIEGPDDARIYRTK